MLVIVLRFLVPFVFLGLGSVAIFRPEWLHSNRGIFSLMSLSPLLGKIVFRIIGLLWLFIAVGAFITVMNDPWNEKKNAPQTPPPATSAPQPAKIIPAK